MKRSNLSSRLLPALALPLVLAAPGCFFDPDLDDVVRVIEHEIAPAEIHPQTTVRIGRALMSLARVVVGFVPDEEAQSAREILRGVHEMHVGVYEVEGLERGYDLTIPAKLREQLEDDGWRMVVKMKSEDSNFWLLVRARHHRVHGAYVIVLEHDELVVVKLEGNLSHTLDMAVREALRGNDHMIDPIRDASGT